MNKAVQKDFDRYRYCSAQCKGVTRKNAIFLHFINKGINILCVNFFLKDDIHGLILFSKHKKDLYNILAKKD